MLAVAGDPKMGPASFFEGELNRAMTRLLPRSELDDELRSVTEQNDSVAIDARFLLQACQQSGYCAC